LSAGTGWDTLASRYDRQLGLERAAIREALDLAAPHPDDDLLDVGTGTGAALRELAASSERPTRVVGVDPSRAMLDRAPSLPFGWSLQIADARCLPFPDDSFQVVLAVYVLHVIAPQDRRTVLAEMRRVLTPGGRLVTVTPVVPRAPVGRAVAVALAGLARVAPRRFGGLRTYDPRPALENAGFRLVRARYVRRGYLSLCVVAGDATPASDAS